MRFKKPAALITLVCMLTMVSGISYAESQAGLEKKRLAIQKKIKSLSIMERNQAVTLNNNQKRLEMNRNKLKQSKYKYTTKQENIMSIQKDLNASIAQYNARQKLSAQRIRYIYKTKHSFILDLLFSSENISKFLDRIYYQNIIIKTDRDRMDELRGDARRIAMTKQKLENEKRELAGIIREIDRENVNIQSTINQNKQILDKIQKDKRAYERAERELQRQSDRLTALISKSTKNSTVVVSGKGFILPVHGRTTSPYGYRIHPIFKTKIFHTGIDYAVPIGTPVKASNSGKVIFTGWYGGYGKVVIIDHGNCTGAPTTTLYAHLSSIKVSVGQTVQRGDTVALSGSTGYSTGPHCHFEVRINGKPQNPLNFL